MIEETRLPVWHAFLDGNGECPFHHPNGCAERVLWSHANKAVEVVGHDHISANSNASRFCIFGIAAKVIVNGIIREDGFSIGRAERYEINWRVIALEDLLETARFIGAAGHGQSIA